MQNKIKSFLALSFVPLPSPAHLVYIYKQFPIHNIPQFQRFAKKEFYQLIHKKKYLILNQEAKDLPLAKIT